LGSVSVSAILYLPWLANPPFKLNPFGAHLARTETAKTNFTPQPQSREHFFTLPLGYTLYFKIKHVVDKWQNKVVEAARERETRIHCCK